MELPPAAQPFLPQSAAQMPRGGLWLVGQQHTVPRLCYGLGQHGHRLDRVIQVCRPRAAHSNLHYPAKPANVAHKPTLKKVIPRVAMQHYRDALHRRHDMQPLLIGSTRKTFNVKCGDPLKNSCANLVWKPTKLKPQQQKSWMLLAQGMRDDRQHATIRRIWW